MTEFPPGQRPEQVAESAVEQIVKTISAGTAMVTNWVMLISTAQPNMDGDPTTPSLKTSLAMLVPDDADLDRTLGVLRRATLTLEREVT